MKNKSVKEDLFCKLLLLLTGVGLLWRCFYSFSWSDESFYLAIVHRLWNGEKMFVDEWYTTQLSAPLLLPFYSLYQWMTGGSEGVYLYFRLLYWGISSGTAYFSYYILKKYVKCSLACASVMMYLLYSRANIGGMSYYNMTLTLTLLATILILDVLAEKRIKKISLFLAGIFLACAVVFTPYLSIAYIGICLYFLLRKKYCFLWKPIGIVFAGTALMAVVYLMYVFSHVTVMEVLTNIKYVLGEPELQKTNPLFVIPIIIARIIWRFKWTILGTVGVNGYIICNQNIKGRQVSKNEREYLLGINFILFIGNLLLSANMIGCAYIAVVLFMIPILLMNKFDKTSGKYILYVFGTAGVSLVIAFSFSSDTGLDAMSIGFVLLGMGAILLPMQKKNETKDILGYKSGVAMVCLVLAQTAFLRLGSVYRDAALPELDTRIESGPAKYLFTTAAHVEKYENLEAAIQEYVRSDDIVFYSKSCFWSYLCTKNEYGTPSSWRMSFDSPRLELYYGLKPEKIPTCIFVLNSSYGDFESSMIQGNESVEFPNDNNMDGFLLDYVQENDYEIIELECATIFRKIESWNR